MPTTAAAEAADDRTRTPAGRADGFGQLLRAEWTKFRTVRGWVIGLLVAALVIVALGLGPSQRSGTCGSTARPRAAPLPLGPGGEAVTDSFYFVHRPLAGERHHHRPGDLADRPDPRHLVAAATGRDASGLVPWAKAGIIIKASTTARDRPTRR